MSGFKLHRLGQIMEPEPGNPMEVESVLNPAAVHGLDGQLYLFPRLVAKGNYSRIAFAVSKDLFHLKRLGLATFESFMGIDFAHVNNKDASFFPIAIPNHAGKHYKKSPCLLL